MYRKVLDKMKIWKEKRDRKPLLLWGARQVGKTWLLKEFGRSEFERMIYLNFETDRQLPALFADSLHPEQVIMSLEFYIGRKIDSLKDLLIFDELQRCPGALLSLKYFHENRPDIAICGAGSLLGVSLNEEGFPVGKVDILHVYPLDFEEYLRAVSDEMYVDLLRDHDWTEELPGAAHKRLWDFLKRYLIVGGLPEAVEYYRNYQEDEFSAMQGVEAIHRRLLDSYQADISKHSGKVNAMHIGRIWENAAIQLAQAVDGSAGKFVFKNSVPGYRNYERLAGPIDWLLRANLLLKTHIIQRPALPLKAQIQENRFKLYYFDVGLLRTSIGLGAGDILNYEFGSYKGYLMENFVAQELTASGETALFCWEGRQAEVEFVVQRKEDILPIEVKSGNIRKSKSLISYIQKYSPERALLLNAGNVGTRGERRFIPIYALKWVLGEGRSGER